MKITVIGGGTSTMIVSVLAKLKSHDVSILTRNPDKWDHHLEIVNDDLIWNHRTVIDENIEHITDDRAVLTDADVIMICGVPVQYYRNVLEDIRPFLPSKHFYMGSICAYGGFDWLADYYLHGLQFTLFGFQLIPFMCNTLQYGHKCRMFGAKRLLRFATRGEHSQLIQSSMQEMIGVPLQSTDFLTCTLWQNNPSLHPPILYALFQNWDGTSYYDPECLPVYIYGDISQEVSDVVEALDCEIRTIQDCVARQSPENRFQKEFKPIQDCILENYRDQVDDPRTLLSCIKTNRAFGSHKMQYIRNELGFVKPNIAHKFFEDCPFGLCIYKDIALMFHVQTPLLDKIIMWNQSLIGKEYLVDGKLIGRNMCETSCPSVLGAPFADDKPRSEQESG